MNAKPSAAVAIDASEWFHDPAFRGHVTPRHFRRLERRAAVHVPLAIAACADKGVKATFFVPSTLATDAPALLPQLLAAGHEVGLALVDAGPLDDVPAADRAALVAGWRRQLTTLAAALGLSVRGVLLLAEGPVSWWRDELRQRGVCYVVCHHNGAATVASLDDAVAIDGEISLRVPVAWTLDTGQPRLVGLPRRTFQDHYGRLSAQAMHATLAPPGGTLADALGLPPATRAQPSSPEPVSSTAPPPEAPRFAIIVPLKDEATGIESLFTELRTVRERLADVAACEFVCVDDGSTDDTWRMLQRLQPTLPGTMLARHERNRGVAAAIRTGLLITDAELCASIDGDLSYDPLELRPMLAQLATADLVTASPYHPRGGVRNVPAWRLRLSRSLSWAYRWLLSSPVHTWTACFRVYRRSAVLDLPLKHEGFLGTAELLVRLLRRGGRVSEHPCTLEARLFGVSKMKVLRTIRGHLGLLWSVARRRVS